MHETPKPHPDVFERAFRQWRTRNVHRPTIGEYPVYDEHLYKWLLHDNVRIDAYADAVSRAAPGKVVLDVGTGPQALLAVMCARAGAQKVYALEVIPSSAAAARQVISELKLDNVIEVYTGSSTEVSLPEQIDLCVSEIIGMIGSSEGAVAVLRDAQRFMKKGGQMLPERCYTWTAPVTRSTEFYTDPDVEAVTKYYAESIYEAMGHRFPLTRIVAFNFPKSGLLSEPDLFEEIDFRLSLKPTMSRTASFKIYHDGACDGMLLWIELYVDEINVINAWSGTSWAPVFLETDEFLVKLNDRLDVECHVTASKNGINPDYALLGRLYREGRVVHQFAINSYYDPYEI